MGYWLKLPKFCNCSKTLHVHMQGYKVGHSAGLSTYVAIKYGGSSMADNPKSRDFGILTINYGLFIKVANIL